MSEGTVVRKRALLVGCNYPGSEAELKGCVNDVFRMKSLLIEHYNFLEQNLMIMIDTDDQYPQPTGANIRNALAKIARGTEPGDIIVFHFSGHGVQVPAESGSAEDDGLDECLVPCDLNLLSDTDFREILNQVPVGVNFTFIADCCHSGGLIDKSKEQIGPIAGCRSLPSGMRARETKSRGMNMPGVKSRGFNFGGGQEEESEERPQWKTYQPQDEEQQGEGGYGEGGYGGQRRRQQEEEGGEEGGEEDYGRRQQRYGREEGEEEGYGRRGRRQQEDEGYGEEGYQGEEGEEEGYGRRGRRQQEEEGYGEEGYQGEEGYGGRRQEGYGGRRMQQEEGGQEGYGEEEGGEEGYGRRQQRYGRNNEESYEQEEGQQEGVYGEESYEGKEVAEGGELIVGPEWGSRRVDEMEEVKNRSMPVDMFASLLGGKTGQDVALGNIRTSLFQAFGKDASPMVQTFVGIIAKHAQAYMSGHPPEGGLMGLFGSVAMDFVKAQISGGGGGPMADILGGVMGGGGMPGGGPPPHGGGPMGPPPAGKKPPKGQQVPRDLGILISGCQSNETSADANPSGNPEEAYGALSNAIYLYHQQNSGRPFTNRDLVKGVRTSLKAASFTQNPCLFCDDGPSNQKFMTG